ncbi:MAG: redoxin family protein, partial [Planctomycetota bacterium]
MADITLKGNPFHTSGDLPAVGSDAPAFTLVADDLSEKSLADHAGKTVVLSIFPSVDTPVCAMSVRTFTERAADADNAVVVNVSMDLP